MSQSFPGVFSAVQTLRSAGWSAPRTSNGEDPNAWKLLAAQLPFEDFYEVARRAGLSTPNGVWGALSKSDTDVLYSFAKFNRPEEEELDFWRPLAWEVLVVALLAEGIALPREHKLLWSTPSAQANQPTMEHRLSVERVRFVEDLYGVSEGDREQAVRAFLATLVASVPGTPRLAAAEGFRLALLETELAAEGETL